MIASVLAVTETEWAGLIEDSDLTDGDVGNDFLVEDAE